MMASVYKLVLLIIALFLTGLLVAANEAKAAAEIDGEFQAQLAKVPYPDFSGKPPRFSYLRKLLEVSSGAKQVMRSDSADAHRAYIEARKTYLLAAKETDEAKVNKLLDETVKLMYQAIRLASPKELTDRKKERDYKRRLLSVNALIEALERVAAEKKNVKETDKLKANIVAIVKDAEQLFGQKDFDNARETLDEAYLLIKTGIANMRSGDVLVRELSFDSAQEEYVYELDRNDTHQMLVSLLIKKKLAGKPDSYIQRVNDQVAKAETIRKQAEALGKKGKYDAAISALEKSTKELIRAIRMGGVFIPG